LFTIVHNPSRETPGRVRIKLKMHSASLRGANTKFESNELMNAFDPLLKDAPMPQARPDEPSMEEILASIRRIIADDHSDAFGEAVPEQESHVAEPGLIDPPDGRRTANSRPGWPLVSAATDRSVSAAFNALLASRFVQNNDVVVDLTREMLRPMLKAWLDNNLPAIVERLVRAEIERVARAG
jgi:uncharacterized protein